MKSKIVFLTGAGVSRESGIPTYRDTDGIWSKYDPDEVCSIQGFRKSPEKCNQFFNEARAGMLTCEPNLAHKLIAQLEDTYDVTVITQNVDNLHEKAGSKNIIHVHGEILYDLYPDGKVFYSEKPITDHAIRPDIVMFGENVKYLKDAKKIVEKSDIVVIIGTSLQVWPFSELIDHVRPLTRRYVIDPDLEVPTFVTISKPATEGMQELMTKL